MALPHKRSVDLTHNAEIAHRLLNTPGKCQQIHGHSLSIRLELTGEVDASGKIVGMDFSDIKQTFRLFVDQMLDHHLLLNEEDPYTTQLVQAGEVLNKGELAIPFYLPGLSRCAGDPTTENLAMWIGEWASRIYAVSGLYSVRVHITETGTNGAAYERAMNHLDPARDMYDVLGRWTG